MAKNEDLDIVVPSIGGAFHKGDQPAEEQVEEGQEQGSSLLSKVRSYKGAAHWLDQGFCALQALAGMLLGKADDQLLNVLVQPGSPCAAMG